MSFNKALFGFPNELRQGACDGAEGIANPWANQSYNTYDNDCHKSKDNRILDKALTSFF
ncbi:MAG TPA: hypothetical protein VN843_26405 [Anaerolineales bacterium]|nr:hypothetical protein [Anaerolineales bacterium]